MTEILRLSLGFVNAYLLRLGETSILVDTGASPRRLLAALEQAGQPPGDLRMVLLTHHHPDHSGAAAFLREEFDIPLALHPQDTLPGRLGSRGLSGLLLCAASRAAVAQCPPLLASIPLEDGQKLHAFGIPGTVLHLPGHTAGSVGVLLDENRFLCGDLYMNFLSPHLATIAEDFDRLCQSERKLLAHPVDTVFPGHGGPFRFARLPQPGQGVSGFPTRQPCPKTSDCAEA